MANEGESVVAFVFGWAFLFIAALGATVLTFPVVATSLSLDQLLPAECDQPLVSWILGILAAFAYSVLFLCFHQLTGHPEKDRCTCVAKLCTCAVGLFLIGSEVIGTLWYSWAEDCSQELKDFVAWALIYLYGGVPLLCCSYWALVCFGTAALSVPADFPESKGGPAVHPTMPRPSLRRGTARELLRRSFAQPARTTRAVPLCSRCSRLLQQSEVEAARAVTGPKLCGSCLLDSEQRSGEAERHTQLVRQFEESQRWQLTTHRQVAEHHAKVEADLEQLRADTASQEAVVELQGYLDTVAGQLRRQGRKQVVALLSASPSAVESLIQTIFTKWRLLVRRLGPFAVGHLLAQKQRRLEAANAEEQLLRLFAAWCNVTSCAGPTTDQRPRPDDSAAVAPDAAASPPPAAAAERTPAAERERPAAAEGAAASSGGSGPRARGPGEPARALRLTVVGATGLRRTPGQLASESFCVCEVPGRPSLRFQTPVINNTLDPVWNHGVDIPSFGDREWLAFTVYIQNSNGAPDAVGTLALAAGELRRAGFDGEIPLVSAGWEIGQAQLRLQVPRAAAEDTVDAAAIATSVPGVEVAAEAPPATSADASVEAAVVRPAPRLEWTDEAFRAVSVDGSTEEDPVDESAAAMVVSVRPPESVSVEETSMAATVGEGASMGASRPSGELDSAEREVPGIAVQLASPVSETSSSAGSVSEHSFFRPDQATASSTVADGTRHSQPDMEEADLEGRAPVQHGLLLSAAEDTPQPPSDVDDPQQQPCAVAKCCPIGQDEEDLDASVDEATHHQPAIAVADESQDPEPLVAAAEEASQPQPSVAADVAADEEVNDSWPPVAATEEAGQSQPIMVVIEEFEDPQLYVAVVEEATQPLVAATEEAENPQLPEASVEEARQPQPLVAATEEIDDPQPPAAAVREASQARPPIEEAEDPQSPAAAVHQTCHFQPLIEEAEDPQNPAAAVQAARQPLPHTEEAEDPQSPAAAGPEARQPTKEAEHPESPTVAVHEPSQLRPHIKEAEDPQSPAVAFQEASQPRPHIEEAEEPQSPAAAVLEASQPRPPIEQTEDAQSPAAAVQDASQPLPHIDEAEDSQSPAAAVQETRRPVAEAEDPTSPAAAVPEARQPTKEAEDPEYPTVAVHEPSQRRLHIKEAEDPQSPAAAVQEASRPRPHIEEAEDPQTSVADVREVKDVRIAADQEDGHPAQLRAANTFTPVVPGMPTLPVPAAPRSPAAPGPRRGGPPGRRGPVAAAARAAGGGPSCGGGAAGAEAAAAALPQRSPDISAAPAAPVKPAEPASSEKSGAEGSRSRGRLGALGMAKLAAQSFSDAAKKAELDSGAFPSSDSKQAHDHGDPADQSSGAVLASPTSPDIRTVAGATQVVSDDTGVGVTDIFIVTANGSAPSGLTEHIGCGTDTTSQSTEASVGLPSGSVAASTGEENSQLQGRLGALGMASLAAQAFWDAAKESEVGGIASPSSDLTEETDLGDAAHQPSGTTALASPASPDVRKVAGTTDVNIDDADEDNAGVSMEAAKKSAPDVLTGRIGCRTDTNSQSTEASDGLPGGSMAASTGEDDGRLNGRLGALAMASVAGQAFADAAKEPDTDSSVASAADSPEVSYLDDVGDQRSGVLAMASLAGQAVMEVTRTGKTSTDCSGMDNSSTLAEEEHGQTLHQDSAVALEGHGAVKPMLHGTEAAGAGLNAFDDDAASSTSSSADSYAKPVDCALDGAVEQASSSSAAAPLIQGEAKALPGQSPGAWSMALCAGRTFMERAGSAEGSAGEFIEQAGRGQRTACPAEPSGPTSDAEMSRAKAPSLEPVAVQLTAHTAEPDVVAAEEDVRMEFMEVDSESSSSSDESS